MIESFANFISQLINIYIKEQHNLSKWYFVIMGVCILYTTHPPPQKKKKKKNQLLDMHEYWKTLVEHTGSTVHHVLTTAQKFSAVWAIFKYQNYLMLKKYWIIFNNLIFMAEVWHIYDPKYSLDGKFIVIDQ